MINPVDKYIKYIHNSGLKVDGPFSSSYCLVKNFDEDWSPIGPQIREDLEKKDLAFTIGDKLFTY